MTAGTGTCHNSAILFIASPSGTGSSPIYDTPSAPGLEEDADAEVHNPLPIPVTAAAGVPVLDEIDRGVQVHPPADPDLPARAYQARKAGIAKTEAVVEV